MRERIAIIDGVRTPFTKAGGVLKDVEADDLGAYVVKELMSRTGFPADEIETVVVGNAVQPVTATNVARIIALKAGLPKEIPAFTVQRNCASGFEAITSGTNKLLAGETDVVLAAAAESMSRIPILYSNALREWLMGFFRARSIGQKLAHLAKLRPGFFKPVIGLELGLSDPVCGLNMGLTAEILANDFAISREEQDAFALESHMKAKAAIEEGRMAEEVMSLPVPPKYKKVQEQDDGPRFNQTNEALAKLKPYFDRVAGTVTAGNASQVTDGAVATLLMRESTAKERGLKPLGYLRDYSYAGLEGRRMGLGPVYSTARLLKETGMSMSDFSIIELNEAFASQALACVRASASAEFAKEQLGLDKALGEINPDILNVNGGAIALGHPVGATGMRLAVTTLRELRRRNKNLGLATLCVGGGQGGSLALEVE